MEHDECVRKGEFGTMQTQIIGILDRLDRPKTKQTSTPKVYSPKKSSRRGLMRSSNEYLSYLVILKHLWDLFKEP